VGHWKKMVFDQTDLAKMRTLAERTDLARETEAFVDRKDWKGELDLLPALLNFLLQAVRLSQKGFVALLGRKHQKMWMSQMKRRGWVDLGC
jgi:hypothetical protein